MKTLHEYIATGILISLVTLSTMILYGQKNNEGESLIIPLDQVLVDGNSASFEKMVSNIVTKTDFNYRKALRGAKISKKQYVFSGKEISEVEILKHFKRAARRSDSVDAFRNYFYERELAFVDVLNGRTIASLYTTIRADTFNGYLDDLDAAFGSTY